MACCSMNFNQACVYDGVYNQAGAYTQEYNQGAIYNQDGFYNQNGIYSQDGMYNQVGAYNHAGFSAAYGEAAVGMGMMYHRDHAPAGTRMMYQTPNWKGAQDRKKKGKTGSPTDGGNDGWVRKEGATPANSAPQRPGNSFLDTPQPTYAQQRAQCFQKRLPRLPFVRTWRMNAAAPSLGTSSCPGDIASSVVLKGMQASLCDDSLVEAMLEQAGLESSIKTFTCTTNDQEGEIVVELCSQKAAERCIEHFNGRQWGNCILSAALVLPQGNSDLAKNCDGGLKHDSDSPATSCGSDTLTTPSGSVRFSSPTPSTRSTWSSTPVPSPRSDEVSLEPPTQVATVVSQTQKTRWADVFDGDDDDADFEATWSIPSNSDLSSA